MGEMSHLYLAGGTEERDSLGIDLERGQEALRASESSLPEPEASVSLPWSKGLSCCNTLAQEGDSASSCYAEQPQS